MTDTQQPKPPEGNRFPSCGAHDLWVKTFDHGISDADWYHPGVVAASVWAMHAKNGPAAAAVSLDIESGPWSVTADMTPTRARTLAAALTAAADIVDQFTAHQAEKAELARYNAGPINRVELAGGVLVFEPVAQGGAA